MFEILFAVLIAAVATLALIVVIGVAALAAGSFIIAWRKMWRDK